jgi:hypothetical protein
VVICASQRGISTGRAAEGASIDRSSRGRAHRVASVTLTNATSGADACGCSRDAVLAPSDAAASPWRGAERTPLPQAASSSIEVAAHSASLILGVRSDTVGEPSRNPGPIGSRDSTGAAYVNPPHAQVLGASAPAADRRRELAMLSGRARRISGAADSLSQPGRGVPAPAAESQLTGRCVWVCRSLGHKKCWGDPR